VQPSSSSAKPPSPLAAAAVLGVGTSCMGTAYAKALKASVTAVWISAPAAFKLADPTLYIPAICTLGGALIGLLAANLQSVGMPNFIAKQQSDDDSLPGVRPFLAPLLLLSLLTSTLALTASRQAASSAPLMKLRGGALPSAEQAQSFIGYLTVAQAVAGHAWTKESSEMYEFTSPLEMPTLQFAKFNYALQIAHGLMLLGKVDPVTALAVAIFSSTSVQENLKAPKAPVVAWAAGLLVLKYFTDAGSVPAWVIPGMLLASALQGTFAWESMKGMYKLGVPLTQQSDTMGKFVNGAFASFAVYLLGPILGLSSAQTFGAYALTYTAYILKLLLIDGKGLFNPVGGYVWAAIFGGSGALALLA